MKRILIAGVILASMLGCEDKKTYSPKPAAIATVTREPAAGGQAAKGNDPPAGAPAAPPASW
jgi:hypothetical protein